jgi:hypothetical protein
MLRRTTWIHSTGTWKKNIPVFEKRTKLITLFDYIEEE